MVSGASGAARSQKAQYWKGPNTIGTRERAWQKRQRRVETCNAGRAGAHRPSEELHPTRSSDVLTRIARERVPTAPQVRKRVDRGPARAAAGRPDFSIPAQRALVGTRSRAIRRRLSDNDIRWSASDRRWVPARPAQHVHRKRNNGTGPI